MPGIPNRNWQRVLCLVCLLFTPVTAGQPSSGIYWANIVTPPPIGEGTIWRADFDGSNQTPLVFGVGLSAPWPIDADVSTHRIYWGDVNTNRIQRSNLDGTSLETVVSGTYPVIDGPAGLVIDEPNQQLYWTDFVVDKIQRTDLDLLVTETLINSGLSIPLGIDLDPVKGYMYWTDAAQGNIRRAPLGGGPPEDVLTGLSNPREVKLDVDGGLLYWVDLNNGIWRANLDGSGIVQLSNHSGLHIALDRLEQKIYFRRNDTGGLARIDFDGSNLETVIPYDGVSISHLQGIAVVHDCNENGIDDYEEILLQDCNGNRNPDDCDPDCGGNGIPDDCETPQACCKSVLNPDGACSFVPPDCCEQLGGFPAGPGSTCAGDAQGNSYFCDYAWACCTPILGHDFCDNHAFYHCIVDEGGVPLGRLETCEYLDSLPSGDDDLIPDDCDNCPEVINPDQRDCNGDGVGDACEPNTADADDDADGTCNGVDGCPQDPDKTEPGVCECGVPDTDSDADGVADCDDRCPGSPDVDSDGDGVLDCDDRCPGDPDIDTDGDGVLDCNDQCPGLTDVDSDFDTILDCHDQCPGADDRIDENGNGLADCLEPGIIPTVSHWGLVIMLFLLLIAGKTQFDALGERTRRD